MLERSMDILFYLQPPQAKPTASSNIPRIFLRFQEGGQRVSNPIDPCNYRDSFFFDNPGCGSVYRQTGGIWEAFLQLAH